MTDREAAAGLVEALEYYAKREEHAISPITAIIREAITMITILLSELERVGKDRDHYLRIANLNAASCREMSAKRNAAEARALKAEKERDSWKNVCRSAGVCMSCALGAPDHFGCTDCLNTGWDGGSPAGFVLEAVATKAESLVAEAAQLLQRQANIADWYSDREDDNFEIWRDWYQASGDFRITVGECRAARAFIEKAKS